MDIWCKNVYRPYIAGCNSESGLLLDDFKVYKNSEIIALIDEDKANRYMIPPPYTGVLRPCDVGISKERLKKAAANWRREKLSNLPSDSKLPCPKRKDVFIWLKEIWEEFPLKIVKYSFTGSGYVFKDGIDCSGETESDSDSVE